MSGRLCCYKQQQHSKLLAQFVFKVSVFRFNIRTKTPDCRINNALIQFVPSCQDMRTQFVGVFNPPFSNIACSIISCLVVGIFMPKNSIVTKFCHLARGSGNYYYYYYYYLFFSFFIPSVVKIPRVKSKEEN